MITNISNPILYAWLNPTFKRLFLQTFKNAKLPDSSDTTVRLQREMSQKSRQTLVTQQESVVRVSN